MKGMNAWQEQKLAAGMCAFCGKEPLVTSSRCAGCAEKNRLRARLRAGCQAWKPGGRGRPPLASKKGRGQ